MSWKLRIFVILGPMALMMIFLIGCSDNITNVEVIEGVTIIPGDVRLQSQEDVNHLEGLVEIQGKLTLTSSSGTDPIIDLSPLATLRTVGDDLFIAGLNEIESLTGLENLSNLGGQLRLLHNLKLSNIEGLKNISDLTPILQTFG